MFAALCILTGMLSGCKKTLKVSGLECIHEPEFGGVYLGRTIEEFNALGFVYGDSVDVTFSNGYKLDDLPYYNGYYTAVGEPLLVAYPGYDYIKAAISSGDDLWTVAGLDENCTAEITLDERGKYLEIQEARDIHYEDDRALYESDIEFANFRSMAGGSLKDGVLYRSASPCDNQHNRAVYADKLMSEAGVAYILDLADTDEKIQGYMEEPDFNCPAFTELYEAGKVKPLALNMNYGSEEFRGKIADGLIAMTENAGPYLLHCTEGKDRTGFVCMLIEAFAGASYEEIEADYMKTFENYYGIGKDDSKYYVIVENLLIPIIQSVTGDKSMDVRTADLSGPARTFLEDAGMTDAQLDALLEKLTK